MQERLLRFLADGRLHSGNELADAAGVSRAAIWKHMQQLETIGVEVGAQPGQGYRLSRPLELLDRDAIVSAVAPETLRIIDVLELMWSAESTNDQLLSNPAPEPGSARVCIAEYQSRGRGRRGRQWFAPVGHGICLSVAWTFPSAPDSLSCLGLAAGVAVLRAVRCCGLHEAMLKWPNDVVADDRKLGGILVDVRGEAGGPLNAVIGVGVNYLLDPQTEAAVAVAGGLQPTSIETARPGVAGRNRIAGELVQQLITALRQFERAGFSCFRDEWADADYLRGRRVTVQTDYEEITGLASGISGDGQLLLDVGGRVRQIATGDVSVRTRTRASAR